MARLQINRILATLTLSCGLVLGACGSDDGSSDTPDAMPPAPDAPAAFSCTAADSLCVTLTVPANFSGTPRQIITGFYESLPPAGPPDEAGVTINDPVIDGSTPLELKHESLSAQGQYFFYVALFMEGGGTFVPEAGDYTATSDAPMMVGSGAVNMGTLDLVVVE